MPNRKSGNCLQCPGRQPTFIDIFAGCGGLSLGLFQAGWKGIFAIERDKNAFETLSKNFLAPEAKFRFDWPISLPQLPLDVHDVLDRYRDTLSEFAGSVEMLVGGPPCQGF